MDTLKSTEFAEQQLSSMIEKDLKQAKYKPREAALLAATRISVMDANGNVTNMTDVEILTVSDKIYKWLIKDL